MTGCDFEAKHFSVAVGGSEAYRENYDRIFGKKKEVLVENCPKCIKPDFPYAMPCVCGEGTTLGQTQMLVRASHFREAATFIVGRDPAGDLEDVVAALRAEADRLEALARNP